MSTIQLTKDDLRRADLRAKITSQCASLSFTLVSSIQHVTNRIDEISVQCKEGHSHTVQIRSFLAMKSCLKCKLGFKVEPESMEEIQGEVWNTFETLEVSNFGRVRSASDKAFVNKRKDGNYTVNRRPVTLQRMIAIAFKVEGYESLLEERTTSIATLKDMTKEVTLDNVIISNREAQAGSINNAALRSEGQYKPVPEKYKHLQYKVLEEFPDYYLFEDGTVYNRLVGRTLEGTTENNKLFLKRASGSYEIAKLMYMAYNPCEEIKTFSDIMKYDIVHADSDRNNCSAANLSIVRKRKDNNREDKRQAKVNEVHEHVSAFIKARNARLITPMEMIKTKTTNIQYVCGCGETFSRLLSACALNHDCTTCRGKMHDSDNVIYTDEQGKEYFPFVVGYVSRDGIVLNKRKEVVPTHKDIIKIGSLHLNARHVVAKTFRIPNWEKLPPLIKDEQEDEQKAPIDPNEEKLHYRVFLKDKTLGCTVDNIVITTSRKHVDADEYKQGLENIKHATCDDFPGLVFYEDGTIYNLETNHHSLFLDSTNSYRIFIYKDKHYKAHQLICYAFNKIEGMKCFNDYLEAKLEVDHIDSNKLNNHVSNLRWVTHAENMKYHKETNATRKVSVFDYEDGVVGKYIGTYENARTAAKTLGLSTRYVIDVCKEKEKPSIYLFKYED